MTVRRQRGGVGELRQRATGRTELWFLDRNRTDGVYGIWGHDLDDLVLTAIRWTRGANGDVTIELNVQS